MESQPQNPEFRINPENIHPCITGESQLYILYICLCLDAVFTCF